MKYVLDASAALCWVLPRPNSGKALQLRADFQNAVHELIAPSVFAGEVASALTKAERQKLIPVGRPKAHCEPEATLSIHSAADVTVLTQHRVFV